MRLSIVVPAHNEEHRIGAFLDRYVPFFSERYGGEAELILVVNGSTDGTEALARRAAEQHALVRALVEPRPVGKGGAVMLGFRAAAGALAGFVDADGATPPESFQDLVDHIGDAGLVMASRWLPDSRVSPRQPLSRRFVSRVFNRMVRLFFGVRLTDTQCGAKLLRREALDRILPHLGLTRWAFDVDLIFQTRRAGWKVAEIPTVWHDVSGSRLRVVRASAEMFVAICRLRLIYSPLRWVVRFYDMTLGRFIHGR